MIIGNNLTACRALQVHFLSLQLARDAVIAPAANGPTMLKTSFRTYLFVLIVKVRVPTAVPFPGAVVFIE
jgi:hypothetical protein